MGSGIAQVLAQTGHDVYLLDRSAAVLEAVKGEIRNGLRLQKLTGNVAAGVQLDIREVLGRITTTDDYGILETADFVIETITEKWPAKEEVFRQLDSVCGDHCVLASNTSAISITRIGSATNRPARVLGIHFMNPVPLRPTVEVIRGFHTTEETLDTARQLLTRMGKQCVVVNDMPGFVSNRVLMLMINEAIFLVQDRVAEVADIDRVFRECLGHTTGPLATADLIGLDTILYSLEVLQESYADDKYRPCPLLKKMVHAGLLGRKSNRGFYDYDAMGGEAS
jgi:3-hydroxybutyryl-CoA dehydrogenase